MIHKLKHVPPRSKIQYGKQPDAENRNISKRNNIGGVAVLSPTIAAVVGRGGGSTGRLHRHGHGHDHDVVVVFMGCSAW